MAKPNAQVQLIHAKKEIARLRYEVQVARLVATRFNADAACIAAHHVFQRKGDAIRDFMEEYLKMSSEIANLMIEDSKTEYTQGNYLEYGKQKVDEAVKEALTEKWFIPWDERHAVPESERK